MKFKLPKIFTIRQWIALGWFCYAIIPATILLSGMGILKLIYPHLTDEQIAMIIGPIGAVLQLSILVGGGWFLGRTIMIPLSAISQASRRVPSGDLEFTIPPSRVREVTNVTEAFTAMGNELRTALSRQAELEEERRFFVSAIAHDLRTPLFALRGYLQGLEQGIATSPEKQAHYIQTCQLKANELEYLIADLFTFTRIEYLDQKLELEPLEADTLINQCTDSIRPSAESQHIALILHPSPCNTPIVGDHHLLVRAINNLLDNALRHTPANGTITISWKQSEDMFSFSIADTGSGISSEDLPHIFEPLYRGDSSRSHATGGAGLGLTIARRILTSHGGTLTAQNGSGGAVFTGTCQLYSKKQKADEFLLSSVSA
jgi:signal transduction histidine kinase